MPDDASWRRDVYLSLDLTKDANAVLYYPTTPQADGRQNLFTFIFKMLLRGNSRRMTISSTATKTSRPKTR